MVVRGTLGRLGFAAMVLPLLAACGNAAAQAKRGPQSIAVQPAEVAGLSRCSQSGSPEAVVKALRDGGDDYGADGLAGNWSDDQAKGGNDGYMVGYAASPSDCLRIFGSYATAAINDLHNKWVVNFVVAFSTRSQAEAAWTERARYLQNFSYTAGKGTGLGDTSVVIDEYPPQWFAAWSKGSSYSILATNYDAATATKLAKTVAARMNQ
jgi:hypothetical protein